MTELQHNKCEACSPNAPLATSEEIEQYMSQLQGWKIIEHDGQLRLEKVYTFPNFIKAIAFTNAVGDEAEKEGHHPALLTEWGKVTVTWWTHAISGLHKNDFIMAAKTDALKE